MLVVTVGKIAKLAIGWPAGLPNNLQNLASFCGPKQQHLKKSSFSETHSNLSENPTTQPVHRQRPLETRYEITTLLNLHAPVKEICGLVVRPISPTTVLKIQRSIKDFDRPLLSRISQQGRPCKFTTAMGEVGTPHVLARTSNTYDKIVKSVRVA